MHAVDVGVLDAQQVIGDQALLAEDHDHRQRQHEGRRHDGQHGDHLEDAAHLGLDVHVHVGKQEAHDGGAQAADRAQLQRVPHDAEELLGAEQGEVDLEGEVRGTDVAVAHAQLVAQVENVVGAGAHDLIALLGLARRGSAHRLGEVLGQRRVGFNLIERVLDARAQLGHLCLVPLALAAAVFVGEVHAVVAQLIEDAVGQRGILLDQRGQLLTVGGQGVGIVRLEALRKYRAERVDHKQQQKGHHQDDREDHDWIGEQFFAVKLFAP